MTRAEVLEACLELPISDGERALMRNIAVHNQAGTLPQLGDALVNYQAEIKRLFAKCRDLLRAQHPHL